MGEELRDSIQLLIPLILQLIGLFLAVSVDPYIQKKKRIIMLVIGFVVLALVGQNVAAYMLDVNGTMPFLRTVSGIVGYCLRPLIITLFLYIIDEEYKKWPAWVLVGINTAIHLTALFSGICFSIDENNRFQRGPLGFTAHIVSFILLAYVLFTAVRKFRKRENSVFWMPTAFVIMIIASVIAESVIKYRPYAVDLLTMTVVTGSVFLYIWLHLQFVKEHEDALMAQQRIQIMMSQIQPHFLYNTLSTIQSLCTSDPARAAEVTEKFGTYLRRNLDSLNQTKLVNISKELEHTAVYAEIEEVRFPKIKVSYDIEDNAFEVPALSVQPLVENAIRHGVRGMENGEVVISTRKESDAHVLIVRDNGKGFEASGRQKDNNKHIGLGNVRERIEKMCHGSVSIKSAPGKGTEITIRIPNQG